MFVYFRSKSNHRYNGSLYIKKERKVYVNVIDGGYVSKTEYN